MATWAVSAYPKLPTAPESPQQQRLPGVLADYPEAHGSVEPLANGTARLLLNGEPCGIYANEERANDGLRVFKNMGLCT